MHRLAKWRLFQKTATGILIVFMGILVFVTIIAYSRPSGSTRQDMAKIQLERKEVEQRHPTLTATEKSADELLAH